MYPTMKSYQVCDVEFMLPDQLEEDPPRTGDIVFAALSWFPAMRICKRVVFAQGQEGETSLKGETIHVKVPPNYVWIEGDNKEHSFDSRNMGPIPIACILGKVRGVS